MKWWLPNVGRKPKPKPVPPVPPPPPPPPPPPSVSGVRLASMFGGIGVTLEQARQQITDRQAAMGRKYDLIQAHYDGGGTWAGVFGCENPTTDNTGSSVVPPTQEAYAFANGSDFMVAWTPSYTLAQFRDGAAAAIFTKAALYWAQLAPRKIILRVFHEFDIAPWGINGPGGPYDPAVFVNVWRNMAAIFRANAPNVELMWCPTEGAIDRTLCESCYPGPAFVDWIASDWYNNAHWATPLHDGWASFAELFHYDALGSSLESKYSLSVRLGKPFAVAETGCVFDPAAPLRKAQWWRDVPAALAAMLNLKILSPYDVDVSKVGDYDWHVDASGSQPGVEGAPDAGTLAGFVTMAKQLGGLPQ